MTSPNGAPAGLLRALPTVVSLLRMALLVPIWLAMAVPMQLGYATALVLFLIAALTDLFDGFLARRLNAVTKLGALVDALADKVLVVGVLLDLALHHRLDRIAYIAFIVIVLREALVTILRLASYRRGGAIEPSLAARAKTVCQMAGVGALLAVPLVPTLNAAGALLLAIGATLGLISGAQYLQRSATVKSDSHQK